MNALVRNYHWWLGIHSGMKKLENEYGICHLSQAVFQEAPTFNGSKRKPRSRNPTDFSRAEKAFGLQVISPQLTCTVLSIRFLYRLK